MAAGETAKLAQYGLVKANAYQPKNFKDGLPQTYRREAMGKPSGPWEGDDKSVSLSAGVEVRFAEHHIYVVLILGTMADDPDALTRAKVRWERLYDEEFISKMYTLNRTVLNARVNAYSDLDMYGTVKVGNVEYTGVLYDVR